MGVNNREEWTSPQKSGLENVNANCPQTVQKCGPEFTKAWTFGRKIQFFSGEGPCPQKSLLDPHLRPPEKNPARFTLMWSLWRCTESVLRRASSADLREGDSRRHVSSSGAGGAHRRPQAPSDCVRSQVESRQVCSSLSTLCVRFIFAGEAVTTTTDDDDHDCY